MGAGEGGVVEYEKKLHGRVNGSATALHLVGKIHPQPEDPPQVRGWWVVAVPPDNHPDRMRVPVVGAGGGPLATQSSSPAGNAGVAPVAHHGFESE